MKKPYQRAGQKKTGKKTLLLDTKKSRTMFMVLKQTKNYQIKTLIIDPVPVRLWELILVSGNLTKKIKNR
jgi:hypothetical protein